MIYHFNKIFQHNDHNEVHEYLQQHILFNLENNKNGCIIDIGSSLPSQFFSPSKDNQILLSLAFLNDIYFNHTLEITCGFYEVVNN